jgi:hypothetical protein
MSAHSERISTALRLIGSQCLRTFLNPTALNSAANAGQAFENAGILFHRLLKNFQGNVLAFNIFSEDFYKS